MGLFGKKEDTYTLFLNFNGFVSLEDGLLTTLFDTCKRHGLSLVAEPRFTELEFDGQTMVDFAFANGVYGNVTWFHRDSNAFVYLYRPVSSPYSEEALANMVRDWFDTMSGLNVSYTYDAKKVGKFRTEDWDAVKPTRRSYM